MTPGVPPVRFGEELRRVSASLIKFCKQQNSLKKVHVQQSSNRKKQVHLQKQYLYKKDTCLLYI